MLEGWYLPKMWLDSECWIIGGGISFPRQFGVPESLIKQVIECKKSLTVYNDYLTPLFNKNVIGTNVAYHLGKWISIVYFCDRGFYIQNKYDLLDFHNLKITDTQNLPVNDPLQNNIKKLKRDMIYGLSAHNFINRWNNNAGGGAINIAANLGVKRIYLLGYDMEPDKKGITHWHKGLPNYNRPTRDMAFKHFLECFPYIANDAKKRNIEIINVNPNSKLDVFPRVKLNEIL